MSKDGPGFVTTVQLFQFLAMKWAHQKCAKILLTIFRDLVVLAKHNSLCAESKT